MLLPSAAAYEYRRSDLPRQYWFVGALARHAGQRALPPRVAALGDERPIVFVCQGTAFNDDPVVLKLAFAALAEEPVHVVGAVARPFDPAEFAPLPSNVILERYVPFPAMLSRSAVMITHAGAGAVHAALSHGVPVVALPLEVDQFEVAARAEHSGAGVVLDVHSCTRDQLRAAVRRRLQDPGQRAAAARLGAGYRASGGPELAAALLERLADTRAPVLRPDGDDPWASDAPAVAP